MVIRYAQPVVYRLMMAYEWRFIIWGILMPVDYKQTESGFDQSDRQTNGDSTYDALDNQQRRIEAFGGRATD